MESEFVDATAPITSDPMACDTGCGYTVFDVLRATGTHMYAHLGSRAQLRLVESLQPSAPPHGTLTAPSKKKGT